MLWLSSFLDQPEVQANLLAFVLTAASGLLIRAFAPRAKVLWGLSHQFAFSIPQREGPNTAIYSRTVFITNTGLAPADDVEVHFVFRPEHYQIWPTYDYTEHLTPDQHCIIKLKSMGRSERASIELLQSVIPPPSVIRVRTRAGECREVPLAPMRVFGWRVSAFFLLLVVLGIFFLMSLLARILIHLFG